MTLQPFPVRHPDPKFVIIEFFGNDNDLSREVAPDLDAMAAAAGGEIAVLAVTDSSSTGQVVEITTQTRTLLENLGEIDTGDKDLITNLLARALISYPTAKHIAIGFSGHGSGVFDEIDPKPYLRLFPGLRPVVPRMPRTLADYQPLVTAYSVAIDRTGGLLTNDEVRGVLRDAFADAGRGSDQPVDLIFFDTCLNGMIEVVTEFEDFAHCIVGSTDLQPPNGWDYSQWLDRMTNTPPAGAEEWGRQAVEAVQAAYSPRVDDFPVTLSAVRAGTQVATCFASLIDAARPFGLAGFRSLDWARSQAQMFGDRQFDSYDLLDFARHLAVRREIPEIAAAADALIVELGGAVIHSTALGYDKGCANGIAFWFPGTRSSFQRDHGSYGGLRFDELTGWSPYLGTYR